MSSAVVKAAASWALSRSGAAVPPFEDMTRDQAMAAFAPLVEVLEARGMTPWASFSGVAPTAAGSGGDASGYALLHDSDPAVYKMAKTHESVFWTTADIRFDEDAKRYGSLPEAYRQKYRDFLGFFMPGDGLISAQIFRYLAEAETPADSYFLATQLHIEAIHAEAYSLSATSVIRDPAEIASIVSAVNDTPCVRAKAAFIERHMNSAAPLGVRYLAGAFAEGAFFASLFAVIFFFRRKNAFPSFCTVNEYIMRDETIHRNFNALKAHRSGHVTPDIAHAMAREVFDVEAAHVDHILRTPVDTREADAEAGLTPEAVKDYVRVLIDQVLVLSGVPPLYRVDVVLPWMSDIGNMLKQNFYETVVTEYTFGAAGATEKTKVVDASAAANEDF